MVQVYPVVSHWAWAPTGWLSTAASDRLFDTGMIDFAGCGVVHMVGGWAGLAGAYMVGPRTGRFDADGKPIPIAGHSATLLCLGTFLLWFGWYGFNPGSMLVISDPTAAVVVARSAVTTTLSAAGGGLAQMILCWVQTAQWDMINVCNGLLCGLVSITAAAPVVEPWAAVIIGSIGAVLFNYGGKLLLRYRVRANAFLSFEVAPILGRGALSLSLSHTRRMRGQSPGSTLVVSALSSK